MCFRCGRTDDEVRLFDGVFSNEPVRACEKCAIIEGIPLLKMPSIEQLKISERADIVRKRLNKISGIPSQTNSEKKSLFEQLKELETSEKTEKLEELPIKLIENFHWILQRERRKKGFTTKQLSDTLSESETALKMLERNVLPENSVQLIKRLEQFFNVRLILAEQAPIQIRRRNFDLPKKQENDEPPAFVPQNLPEERPKTLEFKREATKRITIADLKEMNKRVEADFPTKTSEEVGKEQTEDFGKSKETTDVKPRTSSWMDRYNRKSIPLSRPAPSISELVEKKKEQAKEDSQKVVGSDIEPLDLD